MSVQPEVCGQSREPQVPAVPIIKQMSLSFNPLSSAQWGWDSANPVSLVTRIPVRFHHKRALDGEGKAVGLDRFTFCPQAVSSSPSSGFSPPQLLVPLRSSETRQAGVPPLQPEPPSSSYCPTSPRGGSHFLQLCMPQGSLVVFSVSPPPSTIPSVDTPRVVFVLLTGPSSKAFFRLSPASFSLSTWHDQNTILGGSVT